MKNSLSKLELLTSKQICSLLGISIPTLYRLHAEGKFPLEKIKIAPNSVRYRRADYEAWIDGEMEPEEKTP